MDTTSKWAWAMGIAGGFSLLLFFGTLITIPILVVRMQPDYFTGPHRHVGQVRRRHPLLAGALTGMKNMLGFALVCIGVIMLLTPGQGLLTIFIGLTLANYPGKYRLERWLITRRAVWRSVNWLRRKAGVPELLRPTTGESSHD